MSVRQTEFVNTIIKAGAGAGKTYGLIQKIVDLVREHTESHKGELPRFVVTTFTRKATQEVRERLLMKALEIRREDPIFGELFLNFLKGSGSLLVSTIHGVLNQFLREHGRRVGLDPDFEISAPEDILLSHTLHGMLESEPLMPDTVSHFGWRRLRSFFIQFHSASVYNPNIEALPAQRFLILWEAELDALRKESADLLLALNEILQAPKKSEALSRLESALKLLLVELKKTDDLWDQFQFLRRGTLDLPSSFGNMAKWSPEAKQLKKNIYEKIKMIQSDPWRGKETFFEHMKRQSDLDHLGRRFSQLWLKAKIEANKIELEDLELLSLYILRTFPDCAEQFSKEWNYWFIDEYQDTSPIQVELLKNLIGSSPHYIVGDPQQSIYFFRGARSKVFNEKVLEFERESHRVEFKKINRRSFAPTLHFINDLMDKVNKHQFTPMEPLAEKALDEALVGNFYLFESGERENFQAVKRGLRKILDGGTNPSSIAILCRENKELYQLYQFLDGEGIPCEIFSQGDFQSLREIRDAIALWNFLVNPFDDTNLVEVLRSPHFHCPDETLLLKGQDRTGSLWECLCDLPLPSIIQLQKSLTQLAELGHFEVWQSLILESSLFEEICATDSSGKLEANFWKLVHLISQQIQLGQLIFIDPLNQQFKTESNGQSEAKSIRALDQLKLMTIHASKGLEFDHIFLPFLNHSPKKESSDFWNSDLEGVEWSASIVDRESQKASPSSFALANRDLISKLLTEESERLFYVAITRAKHTLHFFLPKDESTHSENSWALHFNDFVAKGEGRFKSEDGSYEFEVHPDVQKINETDTPIETKDPSPPPPITSAVGSQENIRTTQVGNSHAEDAPSSMKVPFSDLLRRNYKAIEKGILEHRLLESYSASRGQSPLPQDLHHFLKEASFPLMEILERGYQEWPFVYKKDNEIKEGRIDLWGRCNKGLVYIIDYKTGSSYFSEKAFAQLKEYSDALLHCGEIREGEDVHLVVCYLGEKKILTEKIIGESQ